MNDLEAAGKAELTGQIRSFMTWLGAGRKLTQTGRIGLADARQLVELLGAGDKIDPEISGLLALMATSCCSRRSSGRVVAPAADQVTDFSYHRSETRPSLKGGTSW